MYYKFKNNTTIQDEQFGETLVCSDMIQSVMISENTLRVSLLSEIHEIPFSGENKPEIEKLLAELTNEKGSKNGIPLPSKEMFDSILEIINGLGIGVDTVKISDLEHKALNMINIDGLDQFQIDTLVEIIVIFLIEGILDNYEDSEENEDVVIENILHVLKIDFQGQVYAIWKDEQTEKFCVKVESVVNNEESRFDTTNDMVLFLKSLLDD